DQYSGGLWRVPATGGAPQPLTERTEGTLQAVPQVLPGGDLVLFTSLNSIVGTADATIVGIRVKTGDRKKLIDRGYFGQYVPSDGSRGHLLYVNDGVLLAAPFDPARMEFHGAPATVFDGVGGGDIRRLGSLSVSNTGILVHGGNARSAQTYSVMWLESSG